MAEREYLTVKSSTTSRILKFVLVLKWIYLDSLVLTKWLTYLKWVRFEIVCLEFQFRSRVVSSLTNNTHCRRRFLYNCFKFLVLLFTHLESYCYETLACHLHFFYLQTIACKEVTLCRLMMWTLSSCRSWWYFLLLSNERKTSMRSLSFH